MSSIDNQSQQFPGSDAEDTSRKHIVNFGTHNSSSALVVNAAASSLASMRGYCVKNKKKKEDQSHSFPVRSPDKYKAMFDRFKADVLSQRKRKAEDLAAASPSAVAGSPTGARGTDSEVLKSSVERRFFVGRSLGRHKKSGDAAPTCSPPTRNPCSLLRPVPPPDAFTKRDFDKCPKRHVSDSPRAAAAGPSDSSVLDSVHVIDLCGEDDDGDSVNQKPPQNPPAKSSESIFSLRRSPPLRVDARFKKKSKQSNKSLVASIVDTLKSDNEFCGSPSAAGQGESPGNFSGTNIINHRSKLASPPITAADCGIHDQTRLQLLHFPIQMQPQIRDELIPRVLGMSDTKDDETSNKKDETSNKNTEAELSLADSHSPAAGFGTSSIFDTTVPLSSPIQAGEETCPVPTDAVASVKASENEDQNKSPTILELGACSLSVEGRGTPSTFVKDISLTMTVEDVEVKESVGVTTATIANVETNEGSTPEQKSSIKGNEAWFDAKADSETKEDAGTSNTGRSVSSENNESFAENRPPAPEAGVEAFEEAGSEPSVVPDLPGLQICQSHHSYLQQESSDVASMGLGVSLQEIMYLAVPLAILLGYSQYCNFAISNVIFIELLQAVFRLLVVGYVATAFVKFGFMCPSLVVICLLLLVTWASFEVCSRIKYVYEGQILHIWISMAFSVLWVGLFALGCIFKTKPLWNPRYVMPLACLLVGGTINGITMSLDAIGTSFIQDHDEITLLQSFGAMKNESVHRVYAVAVQKGVSSLLSTIRGMSTSIILPGVMCGQILSGISPRRAMVYQIVIIILIALCTIGSILTTTMAAIYFSFDSNEILKPGRNVLAWRSPFSKLLGYESVYNDVPGTIQTKNCISYLDPSSDAVSDYDQYLEEGLSTDDFILKTSIPLMFPHSVGYWMRGEVVEEFTGIRWGESLKIEGVEDCIKSELFAILSGFQSSKRHFSHLMLNGTSWENMKPSQWRKEVIEVAYRNVHVPGTPMQFLKRIAAFQSWGRLDHSGELERFRKVVERVSDYLFRWGFHLDCLKHDWITLEVDEVYSILLATALASRPKVLLLEEHPSLPLVSKVAMEESVKMFVEEQNGAVLWISTVEPREFLAGDL